MQNKYLKLFIFILYTWLVVNSSLFIGAPIIIYGHGFWEYFDAIRSFLFAPFIILYEIYFSFSSSEFFLMLLSVSISLTFIAFIYFLPIHFWWKRQMPLTGFILSVTGLIFGPCGGFFWIFIAAGEPKTGPLILPAVCIFYLCLYYANKLQKKYYPDNKICNAIRAALKWPCLRT